MRKIGWFPPKDFGKAWDFLAFPGGQACREYGSPSFCSTLISASNDLYEQLWPETFVAESNLPSLVAEVRTALHDHGRSPGFIRTVHRFGYAVRAELIVCSDSKEASRPASPWSLLWKGREIPLQEGDNVLGRLHDFARRSERFSTTRSDSSRSAESYAGRSLRKTSTITIAGQSDG